MKAKELMVDDWVKCTSPKGEVSLVQCEIEDYEYMRRYSDEELSRIEPIPLTEEILKANGFENVIFDNGNPSDIWRLNIDSSHFCINIDRVDKYWWISSCDAYIHFHYVHELQHALRLCGLNELADNFKIKSIEE